MKHPKDLHLIFTAREETLAIYSASGTLLLRHAARNKTVRDGQYGHWGNCPPGEFALEAPQHDHTPPFGKWFIPIRDMGQNGPMARYGRQGIGIHGGGSGLPDPFAPWQGWEVTEGCVRLQNADLEQVVILLNGCFAAGAHAWLTVVARAAHPAPE